MDRDQIISLISNHRVKLINNLKQNILPNITQLYNKKFFTVKDCQRVKEELTPAAQASKILQLAISKSNKNLTVFVEVLLTVSPELQELFVSIQSEENDTTDSFEANQSILPWQSDNIDSKDTNLQSPRGKVMMLLG